MTYKEYCSRMKHLKIEQQVLAEQYIEEYPHKDLIGKTVMVAYRFRGKIKHLIAIYSKVEFCYNDMVPVFYYTREDGKRSNLRVPDIYSMKQIIEIQERSNG